MSFEDLGLQAVLLDSVRKQGYTTPTPIQLKAIPRVLEGRDVLAGAQTGTGKTAAFTLPMLQLLDKHQHHGRGRVPRALILTPTRELAAQVGDSVATYGRKMRIDSAIIFGGVSINPQIQKLRRGLDIIIATPGRLLDHAGQRTIDLSKIEILVLDEADRMLDMGFIHDIKKIIKLLPIERQNLLFSATYSEDIKRLADGLLCNPELIEVAPRNAATELVTQVVHPVSKAKKRALLSKLISEGNWSQVLVFTRTKHGANKLSKQLSTDGISATAIHGNKSQGARTKALADFKRGSVRVLVATDIAARGLDIDSLPHVVNFDLPHVPEDYVHRIGRTGRAGESGRAHSLVSQEERSQLRDIERLLNRKIDVEKIEGFDDLTLATDGAERFKRGGGGRPKASRSGSGRSGESGNGRRGQGGYAGKGASRGSGSRSSSSRSR